LRKTLDGIDKYFFKGGLVFKMKLKALPVTLFLLMLPVGSAFAADELNSGDTAWMIVDPGWIGFVLWRDVTL